MENTIRPETSAQEGLALEQPVIRKKHWPSLIKKRFSETVFNNLFTLQVQNIKLKRDVRIAAEQNDTMKDSIRYARRIQDAIMHKERHLKKLFPKYFLFYKPKDIVSGDFFWFTQINNKIIIAVADCTGHGIPGAFMSVLGISLLNQIVIEDQNTDTSVILQKLHLKIRKSLAGAFENPEEETQHDGMDVAFVLHRLRSCKHCFFRCFQGSIYLIGSEGLKEIKGSRFPIGGAVRDKERHYESIQLPLVKGNKLYLFTDGYADQFGGPVNRKLMTSRFKSQLLKTSHLPMNLQLVQVEKTFNSWKSTEEQTDDVLVLGLEL